MENNLSLRAPHIRGVVKTKNLMFDVVAALMPAIIFAVYSFGLYALLIMVTCVVFSMATEYFYCFFRKKPVTIGDGSACVTGILLALNMPPQAPLWLCILGSVFAILVLKIPFGGLGRNLINPAAGARSFLLIFFTAQMSGFAVDAFTGPTPLMALSRGEVVDVSKMIVGFTSGSLGEVSAIAVLLGGAYLLIKRVINWRIPLIYIGTFAIFIGIFGPHGFSPYCLLVQVLGGGLFLGAFFMATDYVTAPVTRWGIVIYAVILGILTGVFRLYTDYPQGVAFSIVISNLATPILDKITFPRAFGLQKNQS